MPAKLETTVSRWLHSLNIPVSSSYLRDKLHSHPDYPSMASITGTLDELGIDNAALIVDKEKLDEVPVPFLAHNSDHGGEFIIVTDIKKQLRQNTAFEKNWNGVAVLAEKPENWHHAENEIILAKEKKLKYRIGLYVAAVILFACFPLFDHFSLRLAALLLSSLAGLAIAVLIIQQELGISNELTEQLCGLTKNTDCEAVMHSKGARPGIGLSWADAGIINFSSFLFLLVSPVTSLLFLAGLSAAAMPFTFFSLYYQWRVVKKWCPLCLITLGVLSIQFFLLLPSLIEFDLAALGVSGIAFAVFTILVIALVWLSAIRPSLDRNKGLTDKNYSLQRFKNNPDIFNALLQQQRRVNITPFENDLQLGNAAAPLQIMVVCNPYCGPCARAHEVLDKLITKNDMGLTVRFQLKAENKEDKRTVAIEYLLQVLNGRSNMYKRKGLHDWYAGMNMEKFKEQYPLKEKTNIDELLFRHAQWSSDIKIQFTPTIFINGYQLPKQYSVDDLSGSLREPIDDDPKNKIPVAEIENNYALT